MLQSGRAYYVALMMRDQRNATRGPSQDGFYQERQAWDGLGGETVVHPTKGSLLRSRAGCGSFERGKTMAHPTKASLERSL